MLLFLGILDCTGFRKDRIGGGNFGFRVLVLSYTCCTLKYLRFIVVLNFINKTLLWPEGMLFVD